MMIRLALVRTADSSRSFTTTEVTMTKKELIEALADYPDDTELFIENESDTG